MLFSKLPFSPIIPPSPVETIAKKLVKEVFLDITTERVSPVQGSIVLCDLIAGEFHSGVYIGNNEIVNLEGDGSITIVSPEEFLHRLGGLTNAKAIYVSCDKDGVPVGKTSVATRALSKVGKSRDYHLLFDNCHQFTSGCITGDFENSDNYTTFLKLTVKEHIGAEKWQLWDEYDEVNYRVLDVWEYLNFPDILKR